MSNANHVCSECGAALAPGNVCRDSFDALLALEWQVPDLRPEAHFFAVSSYVLQHPVSMGYTVEALGALRANMSRVLAGESTLDAIKRSVRREAGGPSRVLRREGDPVPSRPVDRWPLTVADVLVAGPGGYAEQVRRWAESTVATINQHE